MNPELWRTHPALALASLAPVLVGAWVFAFGAGRSEPVRARLGIATWLATRLGLAGLVWGVLGHSGIDETTFFLPQARHAAAGLLPYRDFASAYAPLFAPLLGVAVRVAGEFGPLLLFLVADGIAWLALRAATGAGSLGAWTWAAWPPVWFFTVRYAQDEALAAAFVALALLASRRGRWFACGLALGAGLVVTKPLFALPALAFALGLPAAARRPALLGAAIPAALVYGAFVALGAPVLQPLQLEGANFGIGATVWRVPTVRFGLDLGPAGWLPFVVVAGVLARRAARGGAGVAGQGTAQFAAFAALAPKYMPMYVVMWAPFLASGLGGRRAVVWLVAYGTLLCVFPVLDSGPLQGLFGRGWEAVAIVMIPATGVLALLAPAALRPR